MPAVVTTVEYLSFDAVGSFPAIPLNTPAWDVTDYSPLYDGPPTIGGNRPIPGVSGRLAVPHDVDEWLVPLKIVIYGDADLEGTPYDDARVGVRANLMYLRTNLLLPPGTANGTRPVTFHRLDSETETGDVIVRSPLQVATIGPTATRGVLSLVVPASALTETP